MAGNRFWVVACIIALFLLPGCKSKAPSPAIVEAEGVVLLDGQPLKNVRVSFVPVGDYSQEYTAFGSTDDAGNFTLTCHGQAGAAAGENMVIVEEGEIPEHLRGKGRIGEKEREELNKYYKSLGNRPPRRYANLANSPLTVTVSPNRKTHIITLSSESILK
jgi:hypothetical protein